MKRVAIYIRVSKNNIYDTEKQKSELKNYAQSNNCYIHSIVTDNGTYELKDRRSIGYLLGLARKKEIDTVLVYDLSRIIRNSQEFIKIKNNLLKYGVLLESLTDKKRNNLCRISEEKRFIDFFTSHCL